MSGPLLNSAKVRERLGGISSMTIWRYLNDDELNFPRPITIRSRRFWKSDEIETFINRRQSYENVPKSAN